MDGIVAAGGRLHGQVCHPRPIEAKHARLQEGLSQLRAGASLGVRGGVCVWGGANVGVRDVQGGARARPAGTGEGHVRARTPCCLERRRRSTCRRPPASPPPSLGTWHSRGLVRAWRCPPPHPSHHTHPHTPHTWYPSSPSVTCWPSGSVYAFGCAPSPPSGPPVLAPPPLQPPIKRVYSAADSAATEHCSFRDSAASRRAWGLQGANHWGGWGEAG